MYSNRFMKFMAHTFELEGVSRANPTGFADDPSDPGAATQWGISSKANPDLAVKIKNRQLTREEALKRYYDKYYSPISMIEVIDRRLAFVLFDTSVHGTFSVYVKEIQQKLNDTIKTELQVDGEWGPATAGAILVAPKWAILMLLDHLSTFAVAEAHLTAKKVQKKQESLNLPIKDYSAGFAVRSSRRMTKALFSI